MTGAHGALADSLTAIRLSLHVGAATVWVGGQIVMAGVLPAVRRLSGDAPKALAQAFARLSWPAFAVLVATGIWNVAAVHPSTQGTAWEVVLGVKIGVVALAGLAALLHARAASRRGLAIWGSLAGTASLVALVLGVLLAG